MTSHASASPDCQLYCLPPPGPRPLWPWPLQFPQSVGHCPAQRCWINIGWVDGQWSKGTFTNTSREMLSISKAQNSDETQLQDMMMGPIDASKMEVRGLPLSSSNALCGWITFHTPVSSPAPFTITEILLTQGNYTKASQILHQFVLQAIKHIENRLSTFDPLVIKLSSYKEHHKWGLYFKMACKSRVIFWISNINTIHYNHRFFPKIFLLVLLTSEGFHE